MATSPCKTTHLKELNDQSVPECKTPPLPSQHKIENQQYVRNGVQISICNCKSPMGSGTPDRLKVPKPFKYPERYTSPTDRMISPISKGLLARSRRGGALLPPSTQSKIHELRSPNVGKLQLKMKQ